MDRAPLILVVEDDPDLRDVLARMLGRAGYMVTTARNGCEAVQAMETGAFAAVVTDLIMPKREGIETIIELKRRWPECKIIAVSGGGRLPAGDLLDLAMKLGADAALQKPVSGARLVETLSTVLLGAHATAAA